MIHSLSRDKHEVIKTTFAFYKLYLLGYHLIQSTLQMGHFSPRSTRESQPVGLRVRGGAELGSEGEAGQAEIQSRAAVYLAPGPEDLEISELKRPSEVI